MHQRLDERASACHFPLHSSHMPVLPPVYLRHVLGMHVVHCSPGSLHYKGFQAHTVLKFIARSGTLAVLLATSEHEAQEVAHLVGPAKLYSADFQKSTSTRMDMQFGGPDTPRKSPLL